MTTAQWRVRFAAERRLLRVSGAQIGDELATIDAHLAGSGESAEEAFGSPVEYARSLEHSSGGGFVVGLVVAAVAFVGASLLVRAILEVALGDGGWVRYDWYEVWGAAFAALAIAAVAALYERIRLPRSVWVSAVVAAFLATCVLAAIQTDATALKLPTVLSALLGVAVLAATCAVLQVRVRRDRARHPLTGEDLLG